MTARTCSDCSAPISAVSRGRCRTCANRLAARDPVRRATQQAAITRFMDEGGRQAKAEMLAKRWQTDRDTLLAAANRGRAKVNAARKTWCPRQWQYLNAKLRQAHVPLEVRQRMIAEQVVAVERARLAAMTPFERQMERVLQGAKLIEKPVLRRADHDFSLTGNATGML